MTRSPAGLVSSDCRGNVKGRELANFCADNLGEVERAVVQGLRRVRRAPGVS